MGFLSGAYGKLMAGKLVRDLQYQMTSVQSRLRRVTREIGDMEKNMQTQERNLKAQMQNQMQASIFGAMGQAGVSGFDQTNMLGVVGGMNSMAQSMWQNMFEMEREAQLQPLKDLEDSLQTEKDNLESRLKIAQAEYDAKKEEEKAGVKGLTPDYTGQG